MRLIQTGKHLFREWSDIEKFVLSIVEAIVFIVVSVTYKYANELKLSTLPISFDKQTYINRQTSDKHD